MRPRCCADRLLIKADRALLSSRWRGAGVKGSTSGASTGEGGGVGDGDGGSRVDSEVTTMDVVEDGRGGGQNSRRRSSEAGGGFVDEVFWSSSKVRSNCLSTDSDMERKLVKRMIVPLSSALSLGRLPINS